MILGRGLQGLGMGLIPLGISILRDVLPPEKLHSSIALMSSSMGIGGASVCPSPLRSPRTRTGGCCSGCCGAQRRRPRGDLGHRAGHARPGTRGKFDPFGAVTLGIGLVCLLLAVSKGADWGWTSSTTLEMFAAAIVAIGVFAWWELRIDDPLVDLRITARRPVLLTNLASIVVGFAMYAQSLIVPQLLQLPESTGYGLGQSMLAMGLWMAPSGIMMMLVSPLGARLSAGRGPKVTLLVGAWSSLWATARPWH